MSSWIRVCNVGDCPPGGTLEVVAGDRIVALANVDGQMYAIDGVCAHQGGPVGKGTLTGTTVTCPWHGWQYDVRDGRNCINASIVQLPFEVRVDEGVVFVRAADHDLDSPACVSGGT